MVALQAASGPRPRIEGPREQEIFDATLDLVAEAGYDRLTLDAVATRARASKATLYRRWSSKADLVVDAVGCLHAGPHGGEPPDTGSLRGDLLALLAAKGVSFMDEDHSALLMGLVTAMHRDTELREAVRTKFLGPSFAVTEAVLRRAQQRGEVGPDVDVELIASLLPAVMLFQISVTGTGVSLDDLARHVIDAVVLPAARAGSNRPG